MKKLILTISTVAIMGITQGVMGQEGYSQDYPIELSDPGKSGKLLVMVQHGYIKVFGHDGDNVIVTAIAGDDGDSEGRDSNRSGLKRIPNAAAQFEIVERNNEVTVQGVHNKHVNFEVKVPRDFSLYLRAHHDGYIEVNDVTGELELDAHHEGIVLNNVGGSIVANTHHGEILVSLTSIKSDVPMAFSTYHGDIDITFPGEVDASAKIKTTKGEIYTDFDIDLRVESAKVSSGSNSGTKIEVGGWLKGDLGAGGPEFLFSTYHGDVILRDGK